MGRTPLRPTVGDAFDHSINMVYIRLMRDIRDYFIAQNQSAVRIMGDRRDTVRAAYLRRFADEEGQKFVGRFYREYRGLSAAAIRALVVRHGRAGIDQRVTLFRSVRPLGSVADLRGFLTAHSPSLSLDEEKLQGLYTKYAPDRFSLADRAYIAGVNPLRSWLCRICLTILMPLCPRCRGRRLYSVRKPTPGYSRRTAGISKTCVCVFCLRRMHSTGSLMTGAARGIPSTTWFPPSRPRSAALAMVRMRWPS